MGFIARGHESFYDALFQGLQELGYSLTFRYASAIP
jgi:hypothetical protein